jgi:hypothetical protein
MLRSQINLLCSGANIAELFNIFFADPGSRRRLPIRYHRGVAAGSEIARNVMQVAGPDYSGRLPQSQVSEQIVNYRKKEES